MPYTVQISQFQFFKSTANARVVLLWFRTELKGPKFATFWPHAGGAAAQDRKSVTFWATFTVRIAQAASILDMS